MNAKTFADVGLNLPPLGTRPFVLDQPQRVFLVQQGDVAIFAAAIRDEGPVGPRRYLFRVGPGSLLLGCAGHRDDLDLCAVAIGSARVVQLELEQLLATAKAEEIVAAVATWSEQLLRSLLPSQLAEPCQTLSHPGSFKLNGAICADSERPLWPQLLSGELCWMGEKRFTLNAPFGFPLTAASYYLAAPDTQILLHERPPISDPALFIRVISAQQAWMRHYIGIHEEDERQKESVRLQARVQHRSTLKQIALNEVSELLEPGDHVQVLENPLLTAVAMIGQRLGVTVKGPDSATPLFGQTRLEAIAQASHLRIRAVHLSAQWWIRDSGPILAFFESGQPVALLPKGDRGYELFNPETQKFSPVTASLAARLSRTGYVFYPPFPEGPLTISQIIKFSQRGHLPDLILILMTGFAVTLLGMMIPQAMAFLIDHAIPETNQRLLFELGLALLAMVLGQGLYTFAQNVLLLRVSIHSEYQTLTAVWDRILRLKPLFFKGYTAGDLLHRTIALEILSFELTGPNMRAILQGMLSVLNLGLLYWYHAGMALLVMGFGLVYVAVTLSAGLIIRRLNLNLADLRGAMLGWSVQIVKGVGKLRVAGAEDFVFAIWLRKYARTLKLRLRAQWYADLTAIFNDAFATLGTLVIFAMAMRVLNPESGSSAMSLGTFLAFYAAMGLFMKGIADVSNSLLNILEIITRCERAMPILQAEPEINEGKADPGALEGALQLEHVTFRYKEEGALILEDVSLHAAPGEMIAIAGPSGGGKSTLLRLILGFETPESGAIRLDGQDLGGLDLEAVRRQLGVVLQSSQITAGTVYENIRGNHHLSLEEAWAAARDAGLEEEIKAMPLGMHTHLSESAGLSGGQRQRLLIARALAGNPKILLLDEATSALDNRTQALVSQSLSCRKVTRIVIAHRLSTVMGADRIYVLADGRVVESGSYEQLINAKGRFAQMAQRQIG